MIDIEMARRLKRAGLEWRPVERDFFMVPDRGMDDQVFVVNRLTTLIQSYHGQPTVTFHGTSEWALDDVLLTEVIWLPSESQLRETIALAAQLQRQISGKAGPRDREHRPDPGPHPDGDTSRADP